MVTHQPAPDSAVLGVDGAGTHLALSQVIMALTTRKVLYSTKLNENSTTPSDPVGDYVEGKVDLTEQHACCYASDDDRHVTVNAYEVHEIQLPEWLSTSEWVADRITWKWVWGCGVDPSWPESWQRGLVAFSNEQRIAYSKLLRTKKFRSDFRAKMRDQLVTWLETPAADRKFAQPFSYRQDQCVISSYDVIEAKRTDSRLYYDRNYLGAPVRTAPVRTSRKAA